MLEQLTKSVVTVSVILATIVGSVTVDTPRLCPKIGALNLFNPY